MKNLYFDKDYGLEARDSFLRHPKVTNEWAMRKFILGLFRLNPMHSINFKCPN